MPKNDTPENVIHFPAAPPAQGKPFGAETIIFPNKSKGRDK